MHVNSSDGLHAVQQLSRVSSEAARADQNTPLGIETKPKLPGKIVIIHVLDPQRPTGLQRFLRPGPVLQRGRVKLHLTANGASRIT